MIDYEKDTKIDPDALDLECLGQADLMMKYSRHCADMEDVRDRAKENLEFVKAEMDSDIRKNPENYKLEKVTDKAVESLIPLQDHYRSASIAYLDAKHEYNVARGAVDAIEGRKSMLESLIKLHGQSYFAGPNVPRDLNREKKLKDEIQAEVNVKISMASPSMKRTK